MQDYTWRHAFILTIPILLGYIPLAIAYAVMWTQNGLPALWALVASTFLYAGAMQFLLAGLLANGTSLGAVALATLAVNLRLIFYGFSFPTAAARCSSPTASSRSPTKPTASSPRWDAIPTRASSRASKPSANSTG